MATYCTTTPGGDPEPGEALKEIVSWPTHSELIKVHEMHPTWQRGYFQW